MENKPSCKATADFSRRCEELNEARASHISPDDRTGENPGPLDDWIVSARTGKRTHKSDEDVLMPWEGGKL